MTSPAITSTERVRASGRVGWVIPALVALGGVAVAYGSSGYLVTVFGFAAIYGVFVTGLNFFMGYTGQASFGQNAFAALGGYTTAILTANYSIEPVVALVVAMAISGVAAFAVGYPTLRLRGHYLAMATFALGLIVYEVAVEWKSLTQGYMGISGIPPLGVLGYEIASEKVQLLVLVAVMLLGVWISGRLRFSRFGRALRAIAGSEQAASALGIKVSRYKLAAFVVAALYASVAGSLFAHFVGFISPEVFGPNMVVLSFTMLYLGGIGTTWGPVIGAIIVSLLPEALRGFKEMQDVIYCLVLIGILILLPKGIVGLATWWQARRAQEG
jgi:branched-chain amino acid transport system permease protein